MRLINANSKYLFQFSRNIHNKPVRKSIVPSLLTSFLQLKFISLSFSHIFVTCWSDLVSCVECGKLWYLFIYCSVRGLELEIARKTPVVHRLKMLKWVSVSYDTYATNFISLFVHVFIFYFLIVKRVLKLVHWRLFVLGINNSGFLFCFHPESLHFVPSSWNVNYFWNCPSIVLNNWIFNFSIQTENSVSSIPKLSEKTEACWKSRKYFRKTNFSKWLLLFHWQFHSLDIINILDSNNFSTLSCLLMFSCLLLRAMKFITTILLLFK